MVGTLLANHAEFVDLMVAGSLLGVALVPIDPRTKGDKLVYMLAIRRLQGSHRRRLRAARDTAPCGSAWRGCNG